MRILVDTNVLFSAILFPEGIVSKVLEAVIEQFDIVLCQQSIDELMRIVENKAPAQRYVVERFLAGLHYEHIPAVKQIVIAIRDDADQPILNAAIAYDVDVIFTGDKDFLSLGLERPRCLNASQLLTVLMRDAASAIGESGNGPAEDDEF
ncbi:putative toxin-antitoxin system toxin component, PIN family [Bifidobacterium oedipodis]|uniref:Toxin PIN n=1 Tax=Bifidobacterium oedipodis TaxID=2675322 RepID=A0A7Y0EPH2_9BIFI|nr:putative toxin-antitoxin system toxin component, PIN family [Bifidobacterium sp. DSM 109957]NMM94014.1 toxin PIN [Bifidobacterium sp. DSM 109957]